jgi:integrase
VSVRRYQGKRGTHYTVILELGTDPVTGKRRQESIRLDPQTGLRISTRKRALEIEREELSKRRRGDYVDPSIEPLKDYLARWLAETQDDHTASTQYGRESIVRNRIVPELGEIPLGRLNELHIHGWHRTLRDRYAPNSIHSAHAVLSAALRDALRWRLVARNVAIGATLPPRVSKARDAWTAEQARMFLAHTEGDRWGALWRLLLDSGMRIGEALALSWSDLDLTSGTVSIRKTITISADETGKAVRVIASRTKSKKGQRVVNLAPATVEALRRHRTAQLERRLELGPYWQPGDLIFDRGDGGTVDNTVVQDNFARAVAAVGIEKCTIHVLRHTSATLAVAAGEPLHAVSRRSGHGSSHLTANLYAHASREADRRVSETLARVLEG